MSSEIINPKEILTVLERGSLGHLGCYSDDEVYVVPITYALEGDYIYSHSPNGKKIEMMRKNPKICIEVDEVQSIFDWQSVIAWGVFEELKGAEAARGMRLLINSIAKNEKVGHVPELEVEFTALLQTAIIYRMKIQKITGRHEGQL